MNIHREMAKYRLICIRAHEQMLRLREVQQADQSTPIDGVGASWHAEIESEIYCALQSVERKIHNDICDSYDDKP
jgi:hypothetical protein